MTSADRGSPVRRRRLLRGQHGSPGIDAALGRHQSRRGRRRRGLQGRHVVPICLYQPQLQKRRHRVTLTLPIQIKRLDGKRMLLSPEGQDLFVPADPDPKDHIVRAIGQAYFWRQRLLSDGIGVRKLAESIKITQSRIHKLLPLTLLNPEILKRALTGDLPPRVTLNDLLDVAKQLDWSQQSAYLGLEHKPTTGRATATSASYQPVISS